MKLNKKYFLAIPLIAVIAVSTYFAFRKKEAPVETEKPLKEVTAQTVGDSKETKESLELPALVSPDQQAQIYAKIGGTVKEVKKNPNEDVSIGDTIITIDDVNSPSDYSSGLSANQVKQAKLAVEQAATSYNLAKTYYLNTVASSEKDLDQVGISVEQAVKGEENLGITTSEAMKTAELAYNTAKIAAEQAGVNLENAKSTATQSKSDIQTNSRLACDTAVNTSGNIIVGINNIADLDENLDVGIAYKANLGVLDTSTNDKSRAAYDITKKKYEDYKNANFNTLGERIDAVIKLAESVKSLVDNVKTMLDNSITSSALPQTSLTGTSLSSLQTAAAGYQSQMTAALNQINTAKQGIANVDLNTNSSLENLEKVYSLAKQQEATAKQNLENIKAQAKTQTDNASFGSAAAGNQYSGAKIKLNTQIALAKSQLDLAEISYRNATLNLQNLYDAHQLVSPIKGKLIRKMVSVGDTVTAGQLLAVVGQPENIKLQIYVDKDNLTYIKENQTAVIKDSDNNTLTGVVTLVNPQADPLTKRFLVEIIIKDLSKSNLILGTVVNVTLTLTKKANIENAIILPLSAIEIGQSGNYIYVLENDIAKRKQVEILKIEGETAQIKTDLPQDAKIIIEGNRLITDGERVKIKQ